MIPLRSQALYHDAAGQVRRCLVWGRTLPSKDYPAGSYVLRDEVTQRLLLDDAGKPLDVPAEQVQRCGQNVLAMVKGDR